MRACLHDNHPDLVSVLSRGACERASASIAASILALASGGLVIGAWALLDRFYPSEVSDLLEVVRSHPS